MGEGDEHWVGEKGKNCICSDGCASAACGMTFLYLSWRTGTLCHFERDTCKHGVTTKENDDASAAIVTNRYDQLSRNP